MKLEPLSVAVLALAAGAGLWFMSRNVGGLVTGNNSITQTATNAAGQPVTAYQGAGVVGTIGAATNAASGGMLASIGERIGGWVFDAFNPDPMASGAGQGTGATQASGWDYTGKANSWAQLAAEDGWWPYDNAQLVGMPGGVS